MPDGYIKTKPDAGWWRQEIEAGIAFRRNQAHQARWDDWRAMYRGDWRSGVLPVNVFYMMLRSVVPRLYFRNPSVSITPTKPGLLQMAFARILERVDNKLLEKMKLKREAKRIVQNTFMFGTGVGVLGFGSQFTTSPELGGTEEPLTSNNMRVEYRTTIEPNMPWFASEHTGNLVVPPGLRYFEEARWVAREIWRPTDDIKSDPRLKYRESVGPSTKEQVTFGGASPSSDMTKVYELRDAKTQRVMVFYPDGEEGKEFLFDGDDDFQKFGNGFPIYPVVFNEDDEYFWGVPDSKILEPHQLEINEIKTQQMRHRRVALVKILVKSGNMEQSEAEKLVGDSVLPVVVVKDINQVKEIQIAHIPPELFAAFESVMGDVRQTVGFSRNQAGEFQPARSHSQTTAAEAKIVQAHSEIRVDERRDIMGDMVADVVRDMHGIIFNHWSTRQIVDVVGPGGATVWVTFSGDLLKTGEYSIRVDPESAVPESRVQREAKAVELYTILKTNPLIDPQRLTQYLLHELHGAQFDDMMRVLPPPATSPDKPLTPQEYASLVGSSFQNKSNGGMRGMGEV